MNFIEFNVPEVLEKHIDEICNFKGFVEKIYKRGKLKIVGYFDPKRIEKKVAKIYQKEYNNHLKQELKERKMVIKGISNFLKNRQEK